MEEQYRVFPFCVGGKEKMNKKLNIIVLLFCFGIYLSACGGKQYEIELLAPDTDASASDLKTDLPGTIIPSEDGENQTPSEDALSESSSSFVHICGAVMNPGVYEVAADSRIFEVLKMAGGFTAEAATDAVNLAMTVVDGSKIQIPTIDEVAALTEAESAWVSHNENGTASVNSSDTPTGLVNINTAGMDALMTLPGIGKAKAESIITYREENGKFNVIEDIMKITGIKEGAFSKIKDKICV
jgi:competence protein ComEA